MPINFPGQATATAPIGTETAALARTIFRKATIIETTTPLAANAVFTGPWRDTQADGTCQVTLTSFSNQASASNAFLLQETEDPGNPNFTRSVQAFSAQASTLSRVFVTVRARYWRVQYTNGASASTSFELTSTSTNVPVMSNAGDLGVASNVTGPVIGITVPESNSVPADNTTSNTAIQFVNQAGTGAPLINYSWNYGGAFGGTASATKQGWSKPRTATVFNTVQATASGNTAVWTPATGNKFRLLAYQVEVTANAAISGGAVVLTVTLQDATTATNLTHDIFIPATAVTTTPGDGYVSGWQTLGTFGILSAAANNALNVNLSATLTTGNVRVRTAGVEE